MQNKHGPSPLDHSARPREIMLAGSHFLKARQLVTISIPVLNEAENIPELIKQLRHVADVNSGYDFEFLFTDNASKDRTFELLANEARADARIRVIRFTRNFGFQTSILTNYLNARGEAAVQIDADLQDPPELIAEFLATWEQGYKVVYGIRRSRPENVALRFTRAAFYRLLNRLSGGSVPVDAGDFRLIDRVIIEELRKVTDNAPYLRGVIAQLGYQQMGIPYDRAARSGGVSKFRLLSLIRLAVDGVCSQSTKPLEVITLFGFLLSFLSFAAAVFYFLWFLIVVRTPPAGFTTLVILILLSTGIQAAFTGALGEYIGRIFQNTRHTPGPIIERRIEPIRTELLQESSAVNRNVETVAELRSE